MMLELARPRRSRGDATHTRLVKEWVGIALAVGDEEVVTVNELRCAEPGCPDIETVIGILAIGRPARRFRLLKPLAAVTAADIAGLSETPPNHDDRP